MRRLIMAGGIVVAACLALGCGASGGQSSAPLTKKEFVRKANAICAKFLKQRNAAGQTWAKELPGGAAEAGKRVAEAIKTIIPPSLEEEAKALDTLAPPEKDEAEVSQMLENLSDVGRVVAEEGAPGLSGPALQAFERRATALGLKACNGLY